MEIIIQKRQHGKTKRLIEESAKSGGYIVCRDKHECARISMVARDLGLKIPFPISFDEFTRKEYYGRGIKGGFLIDQADDLLQSMSVVPIKAISLTDNNV